MAPIAEAPDVDSAVRAAAAQGSPVRVTELTSQTRVVQAQPDGTMTARLSARVERVKRDGRWVDVDTTLLWRPDGTVAPRAVDVDLVLSGGGKAPLVRYGRDGRHMSLTWPGRLPTPTLSGSTATYPRVLPGVDLVVRADVAGYAHYLVVKDAKAARNPALRRVRLGLASVGVRLEATRSGGLQARDSSGAVLFTAPPSVMWDSRPGTRREAPVGVAVGGGALTLRPDLALLSDPETVYPVIIDPASSWLHKAAWATILSGLPDQEYWNTSGDPGGTVQVGLCPPGDTTCRGIGVARTYFQFDTGFLAGRQLLGAAFNIRAVHSAQCAPHWHQLYRTVDDRRVDAGTNWNNHPPGGWMREVFRDACADPALGFDVAGAVNLTGATTYFLKASDENNSHAWRRYDPGSVALDVRFNSRPDRPANVRTDPPLRSCKWCGGVSYVGDASIRLEATLTDPDGDSLKPLWRYSVGGRETAWTGSQKANGGVHSATVPLGDKDGKGVNWWVHGWDDHWESESVGGVFVVDRTPPATKPGVSAKLYLDDNRWHGGVGVPGEFTFDAAGVWDIDHYVYGWQDPPATKVDANALGGSATVTLTPPGDGPRTLYVQSVDRAGHKSPMTVHRIYVRAGNGPLAQWSLDGNTEDTAFLGDRDGTLSGGGVYQLGAVGTALRLSGAGRVLAPNTVRTDASFTVTAWARLDVADGNYHGIAAQDGNKICAFCLQYEGDKKAWVFVLPRNDAVIPPDGWDFVQSREPGVVGEWTHLAGVYDAARKEIRLYVNGELAGTAPRTRSWHGAGALSLGTGLTGALDEVKLYDRVLTDAQVRAELSADNVQAGHWKLDETDGTSAVNAVPEGPAAVLRSGASFTRTGGAVGGAMRLSGTGHATTAGPVVRTDRSFSVAAWVQVSALPAAGQAFTALSQDGSVLSAFHLGYRNSNGGRWEVYAAAVDEPARPWDVQLQSSQAFVPRPDEWTHVAAVYDTTTKQLRLYVGGQLAGVAARTAAFHATGSFVVGRGKAERAENNYWQGAIDEVRAYSRVLTDAEIQGIVAQNGVAAGSWRLDGDVTDTSGGPAGATGGGADWTGGQSTFPDASDQALRLNGSSTGYAEVPRHVVDTSRSFSATAWVRLEKTGGHYGVVSQDGKSMSAFKVEADPGGGWSFTMFTKDEVGGGEAHRAIGGTAQVGVWTHLTAVYDAGKGLMSLYVNGVIAASRAHTGAWDHPAGKLQIGRNLASGKRVDYFPGAIDDLSAFNRPLFADEIRTFAGRDLQLIHNWTLDEASGTSAADSVGSRRATLAGGAAFAPGRFGNAIQFDGKDDVASTNIDLRTDASFTVTAWVRIGAHPCDLSVVSECKADAVSLDGGAFSKFRLGHLIDDDQHMSGDWFFEMPEANGLVKKAVVGIDPDEPKGWVHLAGVYDAPSEKIWLYVDGQKIGDGTLETPWQPDGGLQIGRGKAGDKAAEFWPGLVDDVRLYTGVLDKDRILALYRSYPAEEGPATLPAADAGHWRFDDAYGTTAADASGKARAATLKGGTGWVYGRQRHATQLDGINGYAETAATVLDTSRDFSAAAWVQLAGGGTTNKTVLGQDGNRVSTFALHHDGATNTWAVSVPSEDGDGGNTTVLRSSETAAVGDWTHLAVVYRSATRQLRLYVNGVLSAARVDVTPRPPTGPLSIGRAKLKGDPATFFPGRIDEVRAYSRALSDGEVRRVHDDVEALRVNAWRFDDGSGRDYTGRQNLTISGATSVSGVDGAALRFDGVDDAVVSARPAVTMRDSFTVSAWAKLHRTDLQATVVAQDGVRMSGFALQYRPGLGRWVFAAPIEDEDSAELQFAASRTPPEAHRWTHLTGVYDYPARELRLFVDGKLAEIKPNVTLWQAADQLTVGRGKFNGKAAHFFPGEIDEVSVAIGAVPDADVAGQAGWPVPAGGQLGRYVNTAGEHYTGTTDAPVRDGYHFEGTLGMLVTAEHPNTRTLYSCRAEADHFTSINPACDGETVLGAIGKVYTRQPTNLPTVAVYRCRIGPDRLETRRPDCESGTDKETLGYTLAYAPLSRYYYDYAGPPDHLSTVDAAPPGYRQEGPSGLMALSAEPGTVTLMSCQNGTDFFVSTDPACEDRTVLAATGRLWSAPPSGVASRPIYRCVYADQRFVSQSATCEGYPVDGLIGHVLVAPPGTTPVFGS